MKKIGNFIIVITFWALIINVITNHINTIINISMKYLYANGKLLIIKIKTTPFEMYVNYENNLSCYSVNYHMRIELNVRNGIPNNKKCRNVSA